MRSVSERMTTQRGLVDLARSSLGVSSEIFQIEHPPKPQQRTASSQVICVASGKGGTGKTIFSTNLAVLLAMSGIKVTIVDADMGLANSHLLLGVDPLYDVSHLIDGVRSLDEVVVEGPKGVQLLPGGSGVSELSNLSPIQMTYLAKQLEALEAKSEVIIIDCSAGITAQVLNFLKVAHEIVIVTTPEVTSMIDGYAVIKNLAHIRSRCAVQLVINRVRDGFEVQNTFRKMVSVVSRNLDGVTLSLLGGVPHDRYIMNSIRLRQPLVLSHPQCFATKCFQRISEDVMRSHRRWKREQGDPTTASISYFSKLMSVIHG